MAEIQKRSNNSALSNIICNKAACEKSSVEDLAENGYTIGRVLGEGSYSKVKSAMFKGKEIAVKILTREKLTTNFETKFLPRELDSLSKVKHPNIVHVYKIYRYPRRIYIFMELIGRGDLLHRINAHGRLLEFEAHYFFQQIVSAILYLHKLNIAHRDLKCENIMIDDNEQIKVIDFGFCRSTVNEMGFRVLSSTFCGSLAYAAPEVLEGIPYNPMMYDVWSLGCVLYIMVTGTMPFDSINVRKMVECQLNRQVKEYPKNFYLTKPIKDLISHMLEYDLTKRATMTQVSQSSWLKQDVTYWRHRNSEDESDLRGMYPDNKKSVGIQTECVCIYDSLHFSNEHS